MEVKKATIWNPNTTEKKVINVGESIPTGFSLWTGGTASGQEAKQAIINNQPQPVQTNVIDSNTFNAGLQNTPQLPSSSNLAMGLYTDRSLEDATAQQKTLQAELDSLKSQRISETTNALKSEQENLKNIQDQKDQQMAGYDSQFQPLKDKAIGIYDNMLSSIENTNYSELTKQKLDLTNDIINYSKMMREELDTEAERPGLMSVSTGRQNAIKENYTSKIAIAQAAQSAIDGNFNLAFDIMDRGATAIERLTNDRINFINSVQTLFSNKENLAMSEVLRLTSEEKDLLDQAVKDAETKLSNIQQNKETIMEIMNTNPIIANKAGLSLTDTPEQITKKLSDFYVKNPQYTPENQAFIKKARETYFDAGINMNDSLATVQSKIKQSRIYQQELQSGNIELVNSGYTYDENGNFVLDVSGATVDQIAQAIKQVESGGNYNAQGASGESGAYQFMPGTWQSWSAEYARDVLQMSTGKLPLTPENQDAVAKYKIEQWLNQGLTPQQIAAKWNSGSEVGWENKIGVNKQGVSYNVPAYVSKVTSALGNIVGSSSSVDPLIMAQAREMANKIAPRSLNDKDFLEVLAQKIATNGYDATLDELRYSGQSEDYSEFRKIAGAALTKTPPTQRKMIEDVLDDFIQDDDLVGARDYILKVARENAPTTESKYANGREDALYALNEIDRLLQEFEASGGDTNLLKGNVEKFNQNVLKTTGNSDLAIIANEIAMTIQKYRQELTGAAFTESEAKEYARLFPGIEKTPELNKALIDSMRNAYTRNLNAFYSRQLGGIGNFNKLQELTSSFDFGETDFNSGGGIKGQVDKLGYNYDEMRTDGFSDEDIKAAIKAALNVNIN